MVVGRADIVGRQPHAVGRDGRRRRLQGRRSPGGRRRSSSRERGPRRGGDTRRRRRCLGGALLLLPRRVGRQRRRGGRLARPLSNGVENPPVQQRHNDTRDIEGTHRRVDEEVRVVKSTEGRGLGSSLGVVHPQSDGRRDSNGDDPSQSQCDVDTVGVLVFGVFDRLSHREEPNTQQILLTHNNKKAELKPGLARDRVATRRLIIIMNWDSQQRLKL